MPSSHTESELSPTPGLRLQQGGESFMVSSHFGFPSTHAGRHPHMARTPASLPASWLKRPGTPAPPRRVPAPAHMTTQLLTLPPAPLFRVSPYKDEIASCHASHMFPESHFILSGCGARARCSLTSTPPAPRGLCHGPGCTQCFNTQSWRSQTCTSSSLKGIKWHPVGRITMGDKQ